MGCDIHAYIEYKNRSSGLWELSNSHLSTHRDYYSFYFLAQVREEGPFGGFKPLGFPLDCSADLKLIYQKTQGCHSYSYLSLENLISNVNKNKRIYTYLIPSTVKKNTVSYPEDIQKYSKEIKNIDLIISEEESKDSSNISKNKFINKLCEFKIVDASHNISEFITKLSLITRSKQLNQNEVRIVFWFDS